VKGTRRKKPVTGPVADPMPAEAMEAAAVEAMVEVEAVAMA
jgi:hypothetical protein